MAKKAPRACPECGETVPAEPIDRRRFLRTAGAAALALTSLRGAFAQDAKPVLAPSKAAEEMIKELYSGISADQKLAVVLPYESAERGKIFNAAMGKKIGEIYTKPQQELVGRIMRSLSSGEEGWNQLSRGGTWDASKAFENCGANLFGDLGGKYTWVFSGHHLTLRCDGNSEEGPVFGGPLYYGHSPNGYSDKNLFQYQTKAALAVYEAMTKEQREQGLLRETPGEGLPSVKFRCPCDQQMGILCSELSKEAQGLVGQVLKNVLSPYRKEDAEEAMQVLEKQGGVPALRLSFFAEPDATPARPWSFWRLEGPGFVWNFRILPHVHTFVNISSKY